MQQFASPEALHLLAKAANIELDANFNVDDDMPETYWDALYPELIHIADFTKFFIPIINLFLDNLADEMYNILDSETQENVLEDIYDTANYPRRPNPITWGKDHPYLYALSEFVRHGERNSNYKSFELDGTDINVTQEIFFATTELGNHHALDELDSYGSNSSLVLVRMIDKTLEAYGPIWGHATTITPEHPKFGQWKEAVEAFIDLKDTCAKINPYFNKEVFISY